MFEKNTKEISLSKNQVEKKITVEDKPYKIRFTKWSTFSSIAEGTRLGLAIMPSITTVLDMKMSDASKGLTFDDLLDGEDMSFLLTGAATQLTANFDEDHRMDLVDKLLTGFEVKEQQEDNDWSDYQKIEDWSVFFDDNPELLFPILIKSFEVNLYDFFMKNSMFRSNIEKLQELLKPMLPNMKNDKES